MQEELVRLREQLVDRERLAGIGLLASDIAHEIYNPLAWLQLNESMLAELFDRFLKTRDSAQLAADIPKLRKLVGDNLDGLKRIGNVVASMRLLSRPRSDHKEFHDLNEVCRKTCSMLEASFAKRTVQFEAAYGAFPTVPCNEGDVAQAVMNLLVNAKDAVAQGGHIRLRTYEADGAVAIEVSDDGPGVPDELADRIWEPFFTTKPLGTGLGLPMVKSVAVDHGGRVELERNRAGGATFRLWIPLEDPAPPAGKPA